MTVWLGPLEIRRFAQGSAEKLILYPMPDLRIIRYMNGATPVVEKSALHRDGLGSVRAVTSQAGLRTDAGLEYLNARYYDPRLGMFAQPDWWEVTKKGVGTNRYAYSFGDPVNGKDPYGHGYRFFQLK